MIHPRLGMAMRRAIKRGRVIIPGHAKVGPPGTTVDLIYGPLDEGWDLDAFDSTPVLIHDAPRPHEIVLWIGYATGPRVNARCKGPDQKEVDALVASFASSKATLALVSRVLTAESAYVRFAGQVRKTFAHTEFFSVEPQRTSCGWRQRRKSGIGWP